jgi:hypothetical protein
MLRWRGALLVVNPDGSRPKRRNFFSKHFKESASFAR